MVGAYRPKEEFRDILMLSIDDVGAVKEGPIEAEDPSKVRQEPYGLIEGFEWVTMNMEDQAEVSDVRMHDWGTAN